MTVEKQEPISANEAYNGTGSNEELWPILVSYGVVRDPSDVRDSYLATVLINWRNAACKDVAGQYQEAKSRAAKAEAALDRIRRLTTRPDSSSWVIRNYVPVANVLAAIEQEGP